MAEQMKGTLMQSDRQEEKEFLTRVFELLMEEGVTRPLNGDCKVVEFKHPKDLIASFDVKIHDEPVTSQKLLDLCKETFDFSVKTAHPQYFNTTFNGLDPYGLAAAWITDSLNTAAYTFETAPVFALMEHEVLAKIRQLCGFQSGDGIFSPGGSMGNFFAMNLARYKLNPELRDKGLYATKPLKIFVSEKAHYSFRKGIMFMGLGGDNLVLIPADDRGKMIPEELDKAICAAKRQDHIPLLVAATSGTTAFGSFDPLEPMADICEKHGVWFHVDAAWGGSALLSSKCRHLFTGIERARSVTWCIHKTMGVPYQCSAFVLNGSDTLMKECTAAHAQYLFQQDKFYDVSFDTGDKTLQCGRKVDVFKLWLMWKAKGNKGFQAELDHKMDMTRYLAQLIRENEGFELVLEPEYIMVCFWYIPPCLRGLERTPDYWKRLHKVAPKLKEAMSLKGSLLVTYLPSGSKVNFFKVGIGNARMTEENARNILEEMERLGRDMEV